MNGLLVSHSPGSVAIVDADDGTAVTYGQLWERVTRAADCLRRELGRGLVFHVSVNTADSIILYLACLEARCPVALLEPRATHRLESTLRVYKPDAVLLPSAVEAPDGFEPGPALPTATYQLLRAPAARRSGGLHPDLALLLTTSGSTGSAKLVRLARSSIVANAESIVSYLGLEPDERSIQSLPMHYSYGLSLINSHFTAGATVVLTRHSFMRPEFWRAVDRTGCTSFAGVPYVYETLHRLGFDPGEHPSVRTMTQAGGGLRHDLIRSFHECLQTAGARFFVMYGQTEATARISYVPPERLGEKIGSIGVPIPKGSLSLAPLEDHDQQQLVYTGPNVMMGYAEAVEDLAGGDELRGMLHTGDLARVDPDGFFYLTGRLKRVAKLFGRRISLEDVEHELELRYPIDVAATDATDGLLIFAAAREPVDLARVGHYLARHLGVPPKCIRVDAVPRIPLTASGKKDYKALAL